MSLEIILGIVSAVLAGVAGLFATHWSKVKAKLGLVVVLVKEAYEVIGKVKDIIVKVDAMLADDKITPEEVQEFKAELALLKEELLDVKIAFLKLIGKEVA